MQIRRVGRDALRVAVPDAGAALALYRAARGRGVDAVDVVPGATTVLFDGVRDVEALAAALPGWEVAADRVTGELVEVPTTYDGEDLDDVARRWGMTREEAVG